MPAENVIGLESTGVNGYSYQTFDADVTISKTQTESEIKDIN